jgi:hypothetical protein
MKCIKEFCDARNTDVSTMTRELWLEKLGQRNGSNMVPDQLFWTLYIAQLCEQILESLLDANEDIEEFVTRFRDHILHNSTALVAEYKARRARGEMNDL